MAGFLVVLAVLAAAVVAILFSLLALVWYLEFLAVPPSYRPGNSRSREWVEED